MKKAQVLKLTKKTPLLLRRIQTKPHVTPVRASHMTVVTTGGMQPEMRDQMEDAFR